ncbi:uncharacterized protein LOC132725635 isoform X2 [Ruditapes philippinarum]|uniref:uncharacterized protein LOC132725635 isoform X2 n=1 Tax=Ruditapes philippinarum TaxID=129788 RepID=UPI00295C353A|nr:uncharacterized protein LOC132725635 isoform X2 [Ruditapes philippinarum]
MASGYGMDKSETLTIQEDKVTDPRQCDSPYKQCNKTADSAIVVNESAENKYVKRDRSKNSPLSSPSLSPKLSQYFSFSEDLSEADKETDTAVIGQALSGGDEINTDKIGSEYSCNQSNKINSKHTSTKYCSQELTDEEVVCGEINRKKKQCKTTSDGKVRELATTSSDQGEALPKDLTVEINCGNKTNTNNSELFTNVSDYINETKSTAVIFHLAPTITEEGSEVNYEGSKKDFVCSSGYVLNSLKRTGSDENFLGDSLDVNIDSTSINTISDEEGDYLCTQYSESDLLNGTENNTDDKNCIGSCCKTGKESADSAEKVEKDSGGNTDNKLELETAEKESPICVDKVTDKSSEQCNNEVKILKYFQTQSMVKDETESDISAFESFYSLDNTCSGIGTPVVKRIKKTLTWTPRILSEERFSSSRSTTLSSKASFYTAETSGTFFSARSFQLDSCDNFVTCEDFQKLEFDEEPKSKLSKAKNVLVRGRDFVKSKIDCYRKRLPNLTNNTNIKSRILCHNSCGFSCVQKGKEISLYSLPDLQSKGCTDSGLTESDKKELESFEHNDSTDICKVGMSADSEGDNMTVRKVLEEKSGKVNASKHCNGTEVDRNGNVDDITAKHEDASLILGKENQNVQSNEEERNRRMEVFSRGTTDDTEDDLPVGTEATSINQRRTSRDTSESDDSRSKKRLRWVSAIEKSQGTSLNSNLTSNSRVQQKLWECVDQLLCQREMDPEMLLTSLGFAGGAQTDDALGRVPDRFLLSQAVKPGVDQLQLMVNHPELHHLIPVMGTSQLRQGTSHMMPETSLVTAAEDHVDGGAGNHEKRKGTMHRPTFSAVATGVKFARGASMPAPPSPDEETKKISLIPSILDLPNRKALARQGFYGHEFADKEVKETKSQSRSMEPSMSAADKRKRFHHSVKSRNNWSLTDESEEGSASDRRDTTTSIDSWDKGLVLKSFSDRFSSDSSMESNDSYSDDRHYLQRQHSISNLRKQYERTIMESMDGEYPVFNEGSDSSLDRRSSVSDQRKQQVERLMLSVDDDGDYTAQNRTAALREKDPRASVLVQAQKSTQSTLTGSPLTPKDMKFSFDQTLNDGESEFNFSSNEKPGKLSQQNKQSVSIIVEEDLSPQESIQTRAINQRTNSNELTSLALGVRSDSCNTLVPQDSSNIDSDGDLTPRAGEGIHGDALSESASSSATLSTVLYDQAQLDAVFTETDEVSRSLGSENSLKPAQVLPQESFELEEISSADNAYEDWNANITKQPVTRRGTIEKSASTHSDSSGFADLDTIGETIHSSLDISREYLLPHSLAADVNYKSNNKSRSFLGSHDNRISQNSSNSLPVAQQQENAEYRLVEITETVEKMNSTSNMMREPKQVYVCKKNAFDDEDKENKPELSSINYTPTAEIQDKSLVYTLSVPIETVAIKKNKVEDDQASRYVSTISVNVERKSSDNNNQKHVPSSKVTQVGHVSFHKVKSKSELDIDKSDLKFDAKDTDDISLSSAPKLVGVSVKQSITHGTEVVTNNSEHDLCRSASPCRAKEIVIEKKRAKERLVAANSHTANWLLSSEQHLKADDQSKNSKISPFKIGRPVWASTPNLKVKRNFTHLDEDENSRRIKMEGNHSFDLLLDEEMCTRDGQKLNGNHIPSSNSAEELEEFGSRQTFVGITGKPHLYDLKGDSACSSMDESVEIARPSMLGSGCTMPEDHLNYVRLARLVNGPSLITDPSKMPNAKFTPNFQMKNWMQLPKRKHLEEETLLMQHAVQRYKTELCLMENMLFALCRTAQSELEPEDRCDVEELQHLWCEVRKEVIKMEELLSQRIKAIMAGNETYSPLDALEIIQSMIDLLREQLYHQQMCIGRDVSFTEDEIEADTTRSQSACSNMSSVSESWMSDISNQMSDIKSSLASAEQKQAEELNQRIAELKKSLLSEVKGEMSTTQNAKMLQLQLQARDNEIRRLKMELLLQNVNSGGTRKKQMFESDV